MELVEVPRDVSEMSGGCVSAKHNSSSSFFLLITHAAVPLLTRQGREVKKRALELPFINWVGLTRESH